MRVLEPEPVLLRALEQGLGPSPRWRDDSRVTLSGEGPVAAVRNGGNYDIIDLSADFLDTAEANATAFTVQAIAAYLRALAPGGIVSIPVSIRDFPVYALRVLATGASGAAGRRHRRSGGAHRGLSLCLERAHPAVQPPLGRRAHRRGAQVLRRALVRRVVVSGHGSGRRARQHLQRPAGGVVRQRRGHLGRARRFDRRRGAARCWRTRRRRRATAFNLAPITLDRPFFYAVLRLDQLDTILKRLEILPQAEIGALVNLAVLAQAVVIAVLVLLVPLVAPRRLRLPETGVLRPIVYFPALGLGFLFIEIFLIEKASLWLNDRTSGFALVLTGMLVFSGARQHAGGSADRDAASRASRWPCLVIVGLVRRGAGWRCSRRSSRRSTCPGSARAALVLAVLAPVSLALGLPFPLGLSRTGSGGAAALGLGAERRVLCGGDATRQPDCARGRLQPGSALRRGAVCDRAGDVSGNKEEPRVAASFSTITRRGVISAAGALCPGAPVARRVGLDARAPTRRR